MNAIEQVKYLLENFSKERNFIIYTRKNSKKNELTSNPKILEVKILFSALPIIYQVLVRILLEKISHINITQFKPVSKNEVFPESEFKKMLKTHNYNYIFCYFLERLSTLRIRDTSPHADAFTGRPLPPLLTLNDYCYSQILEGKFSPQIQTHFSSHVHVEEQVLIEKCKTKLPLCLPSNDLEYETIKIAKELCPILLEIGDIKNALEILKLIKYDNYQDTNSLVSTIVWCLSNDLSLIENLLPQLKKLEPHHPLIKEALLHLEKVKLMNSTGFSLTDINNLSGIDFELLVIDNLKKYANFATVESTAKTGDYGADIIVATKNGSRIAIQCKRFSQKVNLKAVQEVTAALAYYHADIGVVLSNNGFLNSAINLAKSNDIELWDSEKLLRLLAGESDFSVIFEL